MTRVATGGIETCSYCSGTKKNDHGNTCEFCGGQGEVDIMEDDDYDPDDGYDDQDDRWCWRCQGDGGGIVGTDWDSDDPINGPYNGEYEKCDCCGGSGKREDCRYW